MIRKNMMSTGFNSIKRRSELNKELEELENSLPFSTLSTNKLSKLRVLKATCAYLKKEKHFSEHKKSNLVYGNFNFEQVNLILQKLSLFYLFNVYFHFKQYGFIIAFSKKGELIYISENVVDHLGFYSVN
jgi:hypothetical protein